MSVQNEITRLADAKAAIAAAIADKGVTVPDGTLLDGLAALIGDIETGGGLPAGVSQMVSGLYTPTESATNFSVTHNMGVVPSFGAVIAMNRSALSYESSAAPMIAFVMRTKNTVSCEKAFVYMNSSTSISGLGTSNSTTSSSSYPTTTEVCTFATSYSGRVFQQGASYLWMLFASDDMK